MTELHKSGSLGSFHCDSFNKCESCLLSKDDQVTLFRKKGEHFNGLLDLIYTYVYGPMSTHAKGSSINFITFIDDYS